MKKADKAKLIQVLSRVSAYSSKIVVRLLKSEELSTIETELLDHALNDLELLQAWPHLFKNNPTDDFDSETGTPFDEEDDLPCSHPDKDEKE